MVLVTKIIWFAPHYWKTILNLTFRALGRFPKFATRVKVARGVGFPDKAEEDEIFQNDDCWLETSTSKPSSSLDVWVWIGNQVEKWLWAQLGLLNFPQSHRRRHHFHLHRCSHFLISVIMVVASFIASSSSTLFLHEKKYCGEVSERIKSLTWLRPLSNPPPIPPSAFQDRNVARIWNRPPLNCSPSRSNPPENKQKLGTCFGFWGPSLQIRNARGLIWGN